MEMKCKEVSDSLVAYFLKQKPEAVARYLANLLIDLHRIRSLDTLSAEEKSMLWYRVDKNVKALYRFIKFGPEGDLILEDVRTGDVYK